MAADDGSADPRLAAALATQDLAAACAALGGARVFAAMSATSTAEHTTEHGLRAESSAEMAVLLLERPDGARALPLFLDTSSLRRWRLDARPVRLTGAEACQAALDEGAQAVVLDPMGAALSLTESEVRALAEGWVPVAGSGLASRRADTELTAPAEVPPGLVGALRAALADEPLQAARLLEGPDGLVLGVAPRRALDPAALAALAQRVMSALGPALPPEGLGLAQVSRRGPGVPVLHRSLLRRP